MDVQTAGRRLPLANNPLLPRTESEPRGASLSEDGVVGAGKNMMVEGGSDPALLAAAFRMQGNEAFRKGRHLRAVQLYTQGIKKQPSATLLCNRAETFLKLEEYGDAITDCTRALRLEPCNWRPYARRASALQAQGQCSAAVTDLQHAKRLCPKNSDMFERIRVECQREASEAERAEYLMQLAQKAWNRGFQKGEKVAFLLGQQVMKVEECIQAIMQILNCEGCEVSVLRENLAARCTNEGLMGGELVKSKPPTPVNAPDTALLVEKLKELQIVIQKGGKEVREMLGACNGMKALVAAYPHSNRLVLEILHEACKIVHEQTVRALMRAQPLPILVRGIRHRSPQIISIACSLLNHIATYNCQKVLTVLIQSNMVQLLLLLMLKGSVLLSDSIAGLLAKLAADPRLRRHLLSFESQQILCEALVRACKSDKQLTRLSAAQTIASLMEWERPKEENEWDMEAVSRVGEAVGPDGSGSPLILAIFASEEGGVLEAVANLLARESEQAPEEINHPCSNVEDYDPSDQNSFVLRDFNRATGYVEVVLLNAVRAIECMAYASNAAGLMDHVPAWGFLVPLLSSSPPRIALVAAKALAKYCLRSKNLAMKIASLRPANSTFVVLELAQLALRNGETQTHQAAMLILGELAEFSEFLDTVKKPTPFSLLCTIFVNLNTACHRVVTAACTCLEIAIRNCDECLTFAEQIASKVTKQLLDIWTIQGEQAAQVEGLLRYLLKRGKSFRQSITGLCSQGQLDVFAEQLKCLEALDCDIQTGKLAFSPFGLSPASRGDEYSPDINAARLDFQRISLPSNSRLPHCKICRPPGWRRLVTHPVG